MKELIIFMIISCYIEKIYQAYYNSIHEYSILKINHPNIYKIREKVVCSYN